MHDFMLDAQKRGNTVSQRLYGLFFEDINGALDGGLNAQLLCNNSFEFSYFTYDPFNCESPVEERFQRLYGWELDGRGRHEIASTTPLAPNNPHYLSLFVAGRYHLKNIGFFRRGSGYGIPVERGERYHFSAFLKNSNFVGEIKIRLVSYDGVCSTEKSVRIERPSDWEKISAKITAKRDDYASFEVIFEGKGELSLDYLTLYPKNAWGERKKYRNGKFNRKMVEIMQECSPAFLRFPGGCVVEGDVSFDNLYRWKNTVGCLHERKQIPNLWGGMQSYGIGFYEFFALCEDLKIAPLPVLHCGILCQIRMGEQRKTGYRRILPTSPDFQTEVVDNVVHLLYFAKGSPTSCDAEEAKWASLRAEMGHFAPFSLDMVGIGNENWGEEYFENLTACLNALKRYPHYGKETNLIKKFQITVVTTCGVDIRPQDSNSSWKQLNENFSDTVVDEHVYHTPQWFMDNFKRYDCYDRTGAKVFMGEYATHTHSNGRGRLNGENNLLSALSEGAFLCGCERNSDVVTMTCYAPLFASKERFNWTPNLIWFDGKEIEKTPNFFLQKLFSKRLGEFTLNDIAVENKRNAGSVFLGGFCSNITIKEVKITNLAGEEVFYTGFSDQEKVWTPFPFSEKITQKTACLFLEKSEGLNGIYFPDLCVKDCEITVTFSGDIESEIVLGAGLEGVDEGYLDPVKYGVFIYCGAQTHFEKIVDYQRVAYEKMDRVPSFDFRGERRLKMRYTQEKLSLYIEGKEGWNHLFDKNIWKVNDKLFYSATADKWGNIYLKLVNLTGGEEKINLRFPERRSWAHVQTIWHEDLLATQVKENAQRIPINGDTFQVTLPINSASVVTIT